ncbi:hypothetical protein CBM2585_B70073 [Cupriavidus taiwanensis]|nr:hypothetical protein CBM2585_B70073 [Cupriavidus taiwanensis]
MLRPLPMAGAARRIPRLAARGWRGRRNNPARAHRRRAAGGLHSGLRRSRARGRRAGHSGLRHSRVGRRRGRGFPRRCGRQATRSRHLHVGTDASLSPRVELPARPGSRAASHRGRKFHTIGRHGWLRAPRTNAKAGAISKGHPPLSCNRIAASGGQGSEAVRGIVLVFIHDQHDTASPGRGHADVDGDIAVVAMDQALAGAFNRQLPALRGLPDQEVCSHGLLPVVGVIAA